MPPKKRYVLSTTVRWSAFEVQLFRYLATTTHQSMADEMRTAIRHYARHLPEFSAEGFVAHVKRDALADMSKGPARDQLEREVAAFAALVAQDKNQPFDRPVDRIASLGADAGFNSSEADFELN